MACPEKCPNCRYERISTKGFYKLDPYKEPEFIEEAGYDIVFIMCDYCKSGEMFF